MISYYYNNTANFYSGSTGFICILLPFYFKLKVVLLVGNASIALFTVVGYQKYSEKMVGKTHTGKRLYK